MGATMITKRDKQKMSLYMELSGAIIALDRGMWFVSTPQESIMYDDIHEMMDDLELNLNLMREVYEQNGELEEWEQAEEKAKEMKWRF